MPVAHVRAAQPADLRVVTAFVHELARHEQAPGCELTVDLESIYVQPSRRGYGLGTAMLVALASECLQNDDVGLELGAGPRTWACSNNDGPSAWPTSSL
nr:hypothetical protein [Kibdelosporangium sp. MJ126-NF4]